MITQLRGKLVEKNPSYVVVDCNGVGYWVNISLQTHKQLLNEEAVVLYTYHLVREDAQLLYGFYQKGEREIFEQLISVNGVGPSSAMMMLSTLSSEDILSAIAQDQPDVLQSVKGIGAKTAQRIIIDLKNKINNSFDSSNLTSLGGNKIKLEALSALEVLGIPKKSAEPVVKKLIDQNPSISLEEVIKLTLKKK